MSISTKVLSWRKKRIKRRGEKHAVELGKSKSDFYRYLTKAEQKKYDSISIKHYFSWINPWPNHDITGLDMDVREGPVATNQAGETFDMVPVWPARQSIQDRHIDVTFEETDRVTNGGNPIYATLYDGEPANDRPFIGKASVNVEKS